MSYDLLKNRLTNGAPYTKEAALSRINALADSLEITQEQAEELTALANAAGLDALPKDTGERLAVVERGVALVYQLIDAMRGNPLLSALVDKLDSEER